MTQSRESTKDASRQDKGSRSASGMAGNGQDAAAKIQDQAGAVAGQAQEQASKLADMAREQATTQIATQKERAAGQLGALASALHAASQQIQGEDQRQMAEYIESAAGQLDQFAAALRNQDIMQIADTVQQFARRQPALFMAGTFALGFAATRFFRSSPSSGGGNWNSSGYGSSYGGSWDSSGSGRYASGSHGTGGYSSGGYGSSGYGGYGSDYSGSSMAGSGSFAGDMGAGDRSAYGDATSSQDQPGLSQASGATSRTDWQSGADIGSGPEER